MRSFIQKKSFGSVKIFYLDKDSLVKSLCECVDKIVRERPEIEKIILFGSVIESKALSSSDIDIIFIIEESKERFIDRTIHYMDFFKDINIDIDLFVYTKEEEQNFDIPLLKSALKKGKVLFERKIDIS